MIERMAKVETALGIENGGDSFDSDRSLGDTPAKSPRKPMTREKTEAIVKTMIEEALAGLDLSQLPRASSPSMPMRN